MYSNDLFSKVQMLSKRLQTLEMANDNLLQLLNDEIAQRQKIEKNTFKSLDEFTTQINTLNTNFDQLEKFVIDNNEKSKESKRTNNTSNNLNNNNIPLNIEETYKKEFIQYRTELNNNVSRMELIENRIDLVNNECLNNINKISNKVDEFINESKSYKDFQKQTFYNLKDFHTEIKNNSQNNQNILNDVNNTINDFKEKMDNYQMAFNQFTDKIKNMENNIKLNNEKNNKSLAGIEKDINTLFSEQSKEIGNFENHILSEHDKFTAFIQMQYDEFNNNIKKLFDFNNEDMNEMKEKIDIIQESCKKLRVDVFKGISETEDFFDKKFNSLLRIINNPS